MPQAPFGGLPRPYGLRLSLFLLIASVYFLISSSLIFMLPDPLECLPKRGHEDNVFQIEVECGLQPYKEKMLA